MFPFQQTFACSYLSISCTRAAGAHRNQTGIWHKIHGKKKIFLKHFLFLFLIDFFQGIF